MDRADEVRSRRKKSRKKRGDRTGDVSVKDELNLSMFRAYDIRTPADRLSDSLYDRLASAEAVYFRDVLGADGVVLTHDARRRGPRFLSIAADVFLNAGLDVIYLPGVTSTCQFYYGAMRHPNLAAVMIGASHNPAGDTGQKLLGPGVTPLAAAIGPEGGLHCIRELYRQGVSSKSDRKGAIRTVELLDEYVTYSMQLAQVEPGQLTGTRVLHDYLFGAAGREMMLAFQQAGARLTPLHFAADGDFPLGDPNPVKADVIREGMETLEAGSYDLACFFDGDGDRLDVYAGDGRYLSSSFVYAAVLPEIRHRFPGENMGVFADLKSNPLAVMEMARCGITVDVIRNGHSQIKMSLHEDPTRFGAVEESAHFYEAFSLGNDTRYCTENTLYMALLITRLRHDDPDRFERLLDLQDQTCRAREWGYKFPTDQQRSDALAAVREHFESWGAQAITHMKNGMDLEATLLRRGVPFDVHEDTQLAPNWIQICQRVSQSESGLARWEVVGAEPDLVEQAKQDIGRIVARFGAGEEYQG